MTFEKIAKDAGNEMHPKVGYEANNNRRRIPFAKLFSR